MSQIRKKPFIADLYVSGDKKFTERHCIVTTSSRAHRSSQCELITDDIGTKHPGQEYIYIYIYISARPFVCYQTCERDILKMNEAE